MTQLIKEAKRWQKLAGLKENLNEEDTPGDNQRDQFIMDQEQAIKSAIGTLKSELDFSDEMIRQIVDQALTPGENKGVEDMPFNEGVEDIDISAIDALIGNSNEL